MKLFALGLIVATTIAPLCFSMEPLDFVDPHDSILDGVSKSLSIEEILSPTTQTLFDQMIQLARGEQGDWNKSVLVGLAAPQIGKPLRIILVDVKANGKGSVAELRLYVNPEVIKTSEATEEWYEGCYSTGKVKGIVARPSTVTIRALTREGKEVVETHSGYVARIFQHEIDHLNGIRFPQRMLDKTHVHLVEEHEMPQYRNELGWKNWLKSEPIECWKEHM